MKELVIILHLTVWDAVQGVGAVCALVSIILARKNVFKARMWAWSLVVAGHATILTAGVSLGLEGLYVLNVGMICAGFNNMYKDLQERQTYRGKAEAV